MCSHMPQRFMAERVKMCKEETEQFVFVFVGTVRESIIFDLLFKEQLNPGDI